MLFQHFNENADAPALITTNGVIRYREYNRIIASTAERLKQFGVGRGDRIAIVSRNCPEYPTLLMALFRVGAIAVPINHRFLSQQIGSQLKSINARIGIRLEEYSEKELSDDICWYDMERFFPTAGMNDSDISSIAVEENDLSRDQDATIIFTSGTSGIPKAVLHTLGNHYYSAIGSNQNIPFAQDHRWLLSLPLHHVGGLAILFRAIINAGAVIIPAADISLADSIVKYQPTHISLVATQLYRLMDEHRAIEQLKRMKAILLGGSAIPADLIERSLKLKLPIHTSYGSTEMSSQITTTKPDDPLDKLLTSGALLPHRELKIVADGEIMVKGKTLFRGYVQNENVVPKPDEEGWFATGDLGRLDSEGYLTVTGRKDNMFISGGENIQPEEIERELGNIQGVREAVVVPSEDEEFGHRPVAFIELEDKSLSDDFLKKKLEERLPRFKVPDYFFPMPPSNPQAGIKVDRLALRDLAKDLISKI